MSNPDNLSCVGPSFPPTTFILSARKWLKNARTAWNIKLRNKNVDKSHDSRYCVFSDNPVYNLVPVLYDNGWRMIRNDSIPKFNPFDIFPNLKSSYDLKYTFDFEPPTCKGKPINMLPSLHMLSWFHSGCSLDDVEVPEYISEIVRPFNEPSSFLLFNGKIVPESIGHRVIRFRFPCTDGTSFPIRYKLFFFTDRTRFPVDHSGEFECNWEKTFSDCDKYIPEIMCLKNYEFTNDWFNHLFNCMGKAVMTLNRVFSYPYAFRNHHIPILCNVNWFLFLAQHNFDLCKIQADYQMYSTEYSVGNFFRIAEQERKESRFYSIKPKNKSLCECTGYACECGECDVIDGMRAMRAVCACDTYLVPPNRAIGVGSEIHSVDECGDENECLPNMNSLSSSSECSTPSEYEPNLRFLLLRSGDVEQNPGPMSKMYIEPQLRYNESRCWDIDVLEEIHKLKVLMRGCSVQEMFHLQGLSDYIPSLSDFGINFGKNSFETATGFGANLGRNAFATATKNLASLSETFLDKLSSMVPNIMSSVMPIMDRVEGMMEKFKNGFIKVLVIFVLLVSLFYFSKQYAIICSVLILACYTYDVPKVVMDVIHKLREDMTGFYNSAIAVDCPEPEPVESDSQDLFVPLSDVRLQGAFTETAEKVLFNPWFKTIGECMLAFLSFFLLGAIPGASTWDKYLRRLDLIPKAISGSSKIVEWAGVYFKTASDFLKMTILDCERKDLSIFDALKDDVDRWRARIVHFSHMSTKELARVDATASEEIEALYIQGLQWQSDFSLPKECREVVTTLQPYIKALYDSVYSSNAKGGGIRPKPVYLWLVGESQIGKTSDIFPFFVNFCASLGIKDPQAYSKYVYMHNSVNEYYEGLSRYHIGMGVDDFGQRKETAGNPDGDKADAIFLGGCAPWRPHMANVNDKSMTVKLRFVVYTSNQKEQSTVNLTHPEAFWARMMEFCYEVIVKPEYARWCPKLKRNILDVTKLPKGTYPCTKDGSDIHLFQKLGRTPDGVWYNIGSPITFQALSDLVCDAIRRETLKHREALANLEAMENASMEFFEKLYSHPEYDERLPISVQRHLVNPIVNNNVEALSPAQILDPLNLNVRIPNVTIPPPPIVPPPSNAVLSLPNCTFKQDCEHCKKIPPLDFGKVVLQSDETVHVEGDDVADFKSVFSDNLEEVDLSEPDEREWCINSQKCMQIERTRYVRAYKLGDFFTCAKIEDKLRSLGSDYYERFCNFMTTFRCRKFEFPSSVNDVLNRWAKFIESMRAECKAILYKHPVVTILSILGVVVSVFSLYKLFSSKTESQAAYSAATTHRRTLVEGAYAQQQAPRRVLVEGSYPQPTQKSQRVIVESADSSNSFGEIVQLHQADDDRASHISSTLLPQNTYRFAIGCNNVSKKLGQCVFVAGRCAVMNYHFLMTCHDFYFSHQSPSYIFLHHPSKPYPFKIPLEHFLDLSDEATIRPTKNVKSLKFPDGSFKDAVVLNFDQTVVPLHRNILSHFIKAKDQKLVSSGNACLTALTNVGKDGNVAVAFKYLKDLKARDVALGFNSSGVSWSQREQYSYHAPTVIGDCGSLVVVFNKKLERKIVGMHYAGTEKSCEGLAVPLNEETLTAAIESFGVFAKISVEPPTLQGFTENHEVILPEGNFVPIGETTLKAGQATKSQIVKSPLYGKLKEPKCKPAHLKPFVKDGVLVDPLMNGLKKCGGVTEHIDNDLLESACNDVSRIVRESFNNSVELSDYFGVLSYEEAVTGNGDEFIRGVRRNTSPGYPYCVNNPGSGKQYWLGSGEHYDFSSVGAKQLRSDFDALIEDCKNGVIRNVLYVDTLKDERRPISKVDEGKTRVFSAAPQHFVIALRKYFLKFAAWIMHNKIDNGSAVGINPYSIEWDSLCRRLRSKGSHIFAGDFSNFDGSLNPIILWAIYYHIYLPWASQFLDLDSDEGFVFKRITYCLWACVVNSVHVRGSVVYQWLKSQPSGNPLTVIINTLYLLVLFRIVWMMIMRDVCPPLSSLSSYNMHVAEIGYGDDSCHNVSDTAIEFFNQLSVTECLARLGHVYTDESKSGSVSRSRGINDITFLKRSFRYHPVLCRYVAPLDIDVIYEMLNWTRSSVQTEVDFVDTVETAFREIVLHGEEEYKCLKKLITYQERLLARLPAIKTYKDYCYDLLYASDPYYQFRFDGV